MRPARALEGNRSRETSQCRVLGDERVVFAQLESPLREKYHANLSAGLTSFEHCVQGHTSLLASTHAHSAVDAFVSMQMMLTVDRPRIDA